MDRQSQMVGEKVDCAGNVAPDLISCIREGDKCTTTGRHKVRWSAKKVDCAGLMLHLT